MYDSGTVDSNGDDQYVLAETDGTVVDVFGILGTDGTSTTSEFEDGRVERISSVTTPQSTYNVNNFTVDGDNGNGDGAQNAPGGG